MNKKNPIQPETSLSSIIHSSDRADPLQCWDNLLGFYFARTSKETQGKNLSWSLELGMREREKLQRESHSWSQIREPSQAEGTQHLTSTEILMLWGVEEGQDLM